MPVGYPDLEECLRERISVELRVCPRARDRAHIDEQINGHLLKQSHKFANRPRRMANRKDCRNRLRLSRGFFDRHIKYKGVRLRAFSLGESDAAIDTVYCNSVVVRPKRSVIARDREKRPGLSD